MTLDNTLERCLQQIEADESIDSCLARYPDQAAELAPMLAAAVQVRSMARQHLSEAQRFQARATLRQTLAARPVNTKQPRRRAWTWQVPGVRRLATVTAVALLLVVVLSVGVVASSEPGNPAYAVRVLAERAPALVNPSAPARTAAELTVADRRLADLQSHLERAGRVELAALRAMLASDEAAARQAARAGNAERLVVARRLATHARLLRLLALRASDPRSAQLLNEASRRTLALATRLRAAPPGQTSGVRVPADDMPASGRQPAAPPGNPTTPEATATLSPTVPPAATPTPTATATPTASATASSTPLPAAAQPATASPTPDGAAQPEPSAKPTQADPTVPPRPPRPRQTAFAQTATARAVRATARAETATARASRTPGPGPHQTAMALTATARAETATPRPTATARPALPTSTPAGPTAEPMPTKTRPPLPPSTPWPPKRPR